MIGWGGSRQFPSSEIRKHTARFVTVQNVLFAIPPVCSASRSLFRPWTTWLCRGHRQAETVARSAPQGVYCTPEISFRCLRRARRPSITRKQSSRSTFLQSRARWVSSPTTFLPLRPSDLALLRCRRPAESRSSLVRRCTAFTMASLTVALSLQRLCHCAPQQ